MLKSPRQQLGLGELLDSFKTEDGNYVLRLAGRFEIKPETNKRRIGRFILRWLTKKWGIDEVRKWLEIKVDEEDEEEEE